MESKNKKNTVWIVLTCIFALTTVVLAMVVYRFYSTLEAVQVQLAEAQTNTMTGETNQGQVQLAGAHNMQAVRVMNGILQQQDENEQWVDVAPVADLQQADPVLTGRNKMQELIIQNREAVQNGTASAEQISPLMARQGILAGATLASASQVQSAANKTATQTAKTQTTSSNAPAVTTPAATPAPTQQPVINDDSGDNNSSDSGSSDGGSSDNGSSAGSDSGNADGGSSGGSDSGNSGDNSGDSSDSGDGEDIGWTDEVL